MPLGLDPTTRFSLLNALRLAEMTLLAYNPVTVIKKQVCGNLGMLCQFFDKSDTQAFVCADQNVLIIAFRGTEMECHEDWQTDFQTKLVSSPDGRIHRGFKQALDYVWEDILKKIDEFQDNKQNIWVAGHSLGGALATLAVDRLTEDEVDVSGLYTFGSPRVGDKDFAEHFDWKIKSRTFRFINDEDIVTRVPPRALGYEHIGTSRFFDCDGKLHDDNILWKQFVSEARSAEVRSVERFHELKHQYPNCADDHKMETYLGLVEKQSIKEKGVKTYKDYLKAM
jgi:triacylglycerol lipase